MLKRFICIIMTLFVACPLFACNLFEHNYERDYRQVIAVIDPITETKTGSSTVKFEYAGKNIYKYELVNLLDQYTQDGGQITEQVVEDYLQQIVTRELVIMDVDRQITFGEMTWKGFFNPTEGAFDRDALNGYEDYTDSNSVVKTIYESIDSALASHRESIIAGKNYEVSNPGTAEDTATPTYPLPPSDVDEEVLEEPEEMYIPDEATWPGLFGGEKERSLGEETLRRFIRQIRETVKDSFQVTDEDKAKFEQDDKFINDIINSKGIAHVYPELYKTHYIQFLIGKSAIDNVKIQKIQASIEDSVVVTESDVKKRYDIMLEEQKATYSNNISAYNAAMKGGSETVLFHPSSNYFYVKHILLPFSDAQTAALNAFKAKASEPTPIEVEAFREQLANNIVAYPHVNGENDLKNGRNIKYVFDEIKAAMSPTKGNAKAAERTFNSLIYKYNTDPGIFDNAKGYIEVAALPAGESETYMIEFATGARELYKNYSIGDVYPEYVITDYGVHIMYLANKFTGSVAYPQTISLGAYETPGQYKTIYEIIEAEEKQIQVEIAYRNWEQRTVHIYQNEKKIYEAKTDRFKDLYEQQ